jgi:CNH domain
MVTEFAFYVNKNGRRSRKDFLVHWEGNPTGFGSCSLSDFWYVALTCDCGSAT